jgi:hypothetical protein
VHRDPKAAHKHLLPSRMENLAPLSSVEYALHPQHRSDSPGYDRAWAEHLMARRVVGDLREHLVAFQRRRGHAVVPLLEMDYFVRRLWSYELQLDWAKMAADREIRRAARLELKAQRRAAYVRHGMWTRSRTRADTPALPTLD